MLRLSRKRNSSLTWTTCFASRDVRTPTSDRRWPVIGPRCHTGGRTASFRFRENGALSVPSRRLVERKNRPSHPSAPVSVPSPWPRCFCFSVAGNAFASGFPLVTGSLESGVESHWRAVWSSNEHTQVCVSGCGSISTDTVNTRFNINLPDLSAPLPQGAWCVPLVAPARLHHDCCLFWPHGGGMTFLWPSEQGSLWPLSSAGWKLASPL